jgi:hypothetical protein
LISKYSYGLKSFDFCAKDNGKREGRLLQPPPQLKLSLRSKPLEGLARAESFFALGAGSSARKPASPPDFKIAVSWET